MMEYAAHQSDPWACWKMLTLEKPGAGIDGPDVDVLEVMVLAKVVVDVVGIA